MTPNVTSLLAVARAAARAGASQLATRPDSVNPMGADQLGAETKTSGSDWVTDYDRRSEDAVRAVLQAYRPHDEISGEEYGETTVDNPSGYRWSIDPLDGTTNFIRNLPHYCTSVAVEYQGEWLAGAVIAPALGKTWYAAKGQGAWAVTESSGEEIGLPTRPSQPVRLGGPLLQRSGRLLATGFGYSPQRRQFQNQVLNELLDSGFADIRRLGSAAIDLCLVAEGTLDAYAEYGLQEYDWAAGAIIAEEAGVPVRRPAWPASDETPDWTVAGEVSVNLELDPEHPAKNQS